MGKAADKRKGSGPAKRIESDDGKPGWAKTTGFILLTLLGMISLVVFLMSGLLGQLISTIFPTVYYTEVTADVTAEGQRYQLKSLAKCTVTSKARWGGLVGGSNPTTIEGGLLVKRLPSGAGLMIVGPALCEKSDLNRIIHKEQFESDDAVRKVHLKKYLDFRKSGKRPRILLLDDAENPSVITGYWKEYVTQPDVSLQVHSITYKRKQSGKPIKPEKEIPWLKGRKAPTGTACRYTPWNWVGHYTYVVPEDVWAASGSLQYVGSIMGLKPIEWPKVLNIYEYPIENIEFDKERSVFIIPNKDKSAIGTLKYYKKNIYSTEKHIPLFDVISGGERVKQPTAGFYDPHTRTIRSIGRQPYSKDAVCR